MARFTARDFLKTVDRVSAVHANMRQLARMEVLVGFPEDTTDRTDTDDKTITNAALGYIHDTGMPEENIPARPFMIPGMVAAKPAILAAMLAVGRMALVSPSPKVVEKGLHRVGLVAQAGLRKKINEGIPPPLAEATLKERARRGRKGAKQELAARDAGQAPSVQFAKPLIDTGQLRNAINYVIRDRKKRRK